MNDIATARAATVALRILETTFLIDSSLFAQNGFLPIASSVPQYPKGVKAVDLLLSKR